MVEITRPLVTAPLRRFPFGASRRWHLVLVLCAALGLTPRPAHAYRPFDGTDASIASPHLFELELSPMSYARTGDERVLVCPNVTFNYGTGAKWEFILEGQRVMLMEGTEAPRFEDLTFALKNVLRKGVLQEVKGPSFATEMAIHFPSTGEKGAGFTGALIMSDEMLTGLVHLNAEVGRSGDQELERFFSAIIEGPESWPVRPVTEVTWERTGDGAIERGILGGFIWQTRQGMALDFGLRTALADEHSIEVRTGFTWKLQMRKERPEQLKRKR